jgi:hypothetical protein
MFSSRARWKASEIAQTIGSTTTASTISTVGESSSRPIRDSCRRSPDIFRRVRGSGRCGGLASATVVTG